MKRCEVEDHKGVVWKDGWLGHSETFIRDQLESLTGWDFLKMGFYRLPDPLVEPDYAPFSNGPIGKNVRRLFGTSILSKQYVGRIEQLGATVIHAHFLSGGMNAVNLADSTGLPLVTTLHNPRIQFSLTKMPYYFRPVYSTRLKELSRTGKKFIAVSNYVADQALRAGLPSEKVELLHTGTKIAPPISTEDRNGIIFVGRLVKYKGADHLLQAVAQLPPALRNTQVTIVGDGPEKEALEKYAVDQNLNVTFLGWVSSTELPKVLAQHQVFCGPSHREVQGTQEGFGMVFLEAALQELPCVGYLSGGVNDAVATGETGMLVEEGNITKLSEALRTMLVDDATRQQMGKAGRLRVEKSFNVDIQSKKLQEILLSV